MSKHFFLTILILLAMKQVRCIQKIARESKNDSMDFKSAVTLFCADKTTNFCSKEHLEIIFEIDRKRQERLEKERQMKRMLNTITRILYRMTFP